MLVKSSLAIIGTFSLLYALLVALQTRIPVGVQHWICDQAVLTEFQLPALHGARPVTYICKQWAKHRGESSTLCADVTKDTRCQYQHVDNMNMQLLPLLDSLRKTAFFRFFKVSLYKECPFWPEDGMCSLEACSVCECDDADVPAAWRRLEAGEDGQLPCTKPVTGAEADAAVNVSLSESHSKHLLSLPGWRGMDNPWMPDMQQDDDIEYSYVNLLLNPERYTGYKGAHAHRIWNWIYTQDCFDDVHATLETCKDEYKVFYRIVSGIHTSISAHVAHDYLLTDGLTEHWGQNLALFKERMGPERAQHVQNLYFVYLFVLQAVIKAAPTLRGVHYYTGIQSEDAITQGLMQQILSHEAFQKPCPLPFDVGRLWKGESGPDLKLHLQANFRNITRILDCVGCEKCRLWGKLQFLGVATSLKVLFTADDCTADGASTDKLAASLELERNVVVALFNLLHRLSESIEFYRSMSLELASEGVSRCCSTTAPIF